MVTINNKTTTAAAATITYHQSTEKLEILNASSVIKVTILFQNSPMILPPKIVIIINIAHKIIKVNYFNKI